MKVILPVGRTLNPMVCCYCYCLIFGLVLQRGREPKVEI